MAREFGNSEIPSIQMGGIIQTKKVWGMGFSQPSSIQYGFECNNIMEGFKSTQHLSEGYQIELFTQNLLLQMD